MTNILKVMDNNYQIVKRQYLLIMVTSILLFTLFEVVAFTMLTSYKIHLFSFTFFLTMQANFTNMKFDMVGVTIPTKRSTYVIALYLIFFILMVIAPFAIGGLNGLLIHFGKLQLKHVITLEMGLGSIYTNIMVLAVNLPLYFKLGDFRKSTFYTVLFYFAFLALLFSLKHFGIAFNLRDTYTFSDTILMLCLYLGSMLVAIKLYNRREF